MVEKVQSYKIYKIHHSCDIGNQAIYISSKTDPTRVAVYCQFMAEDWFGEEYALSNLAIANALVSLYGCLQAAETREAQPIDMYADREALCGVATEIQQDSSLHRDGLRLFLEPHIVSLGHHVSKIDNSILRDLFYAAKFAFNDIETIERVSAETGISKIRIRALITVDKTASPKRLLRY